MTPKLLPYTNKTNWPRIAGGVFVTALLLVIIYYTWQAIVPNSQNPIKLLVFAFSTQEEVLLQGILPAFEDDWETETGQELEVEAVFGPSGSIAGLIDLGAPADVALFSNERHVKWLKIAKMVKSNTQPVVIGYSPMVIVTRPGNPHHISEFEDLMQPKIRILHADPRSSGAGEWSLLAEYGSALLESNDSDAARQRFLSVWDNVKLLGDSARTILSIFELGAGDVMITYEQDAHMAQQRGVPLEIIVPTRTIIAENVAVIVDENVKRRERPVVNAFMDYLLSEAGQQIFSDYHMRPAQIADEEFTPITQSFTVEDLGGWTQSYTQLVEKLWQKEIAQRHDMELNATLMDAGE